MSLRHCHLRFHRPAVFSGTRATLLTGVSLFLAHATLPVRAEPDDAAVLRHSAVPAITQVPTEPMAAAEQAAFLAKNVPAAPLPAASARLDLMRGRAADLQKSHHSHLQEIAAGKTNPHAHLLAIRPQLTADLKVIEASLSDLSTETDPEGKRLLSKAIFAALQPIGAYLETADAGEGHVNLLNERQQSDLSRLERAWEAADRDYDTKAKPLHITGPGQLYTITRLSVPVIVQAPPRSKVIFQTFGGGFFTNKMALIEVNADEAGIARTEWVSYGDSIGHTVIGVRSGSAPPASDLTITTVQLKPAQLPEPPAALPAVPSAPKPGTPAE
jgi:hypothetical protein